MYLVKLSVTKDAAITKEVLHRKLSELLPEYEPNGHKVPTDAIRCALQYKIRPFASFESPGKVCRALTASPLRVPRGELHIEIHVQERTPAGVEYTARVCTITYKPDDGLDWQPGADYERYSYLVMTLDIDSLETFGQHMLFEADIRRLFGALTEAYTLKFWSGGTYVCLTDNAYAEVAKIASLFDTMHSGALKLQTITIDNSRENKESVAQELGETVFSRTFEELRIRAEKPGANTERLEAEYIILLDKLTEVETWLGCAVPCQEAQEAFEAALSQIVT